MAAAITIYCNCGKRFTTAVDEVTDVHLVSHYVFTDTNRAMEKFMTPSFESHLIFLHN